MSIPTKPSFHIIIGLTADEWRNISREIDYLLSRAQDLQNDHRLPNPNDDDIEALWITRSLSRVRIRDNMELCIVPSQRTPGSSAYANYGKPAHYIAKND